MSQTVVLTKTASDGREIEILTDGYYFKSRLDGQVLPGATTMGKTKPFERNGTTYSHYVGKIALTADEAATAEAGRQAIYEAERAAFAASPAGQRQALRDQRSALAATLNAAAAETDATFARMHDAQDAGAWAVKVENERHVTAAREALAAFDAQHPEVLTAIRAERSADYAQSFAGRNLD